MDEFGSLRAVLVSRRERRQAVIGSERGERVIAAAARLLTEATREPLRARSMLANWAQLYAYLDVAHAGEPVEVVRCLYLNCANRLIRDEVVQRGTIDEAAVHVREIVARALELGAVALVIVHNHPSGDLEPSNADVELTRALGRAARTMGIALYDHLVVGLAGRISLRQRGII